MHRTISLLFLESLFLCRQHMELFARNTAVSRISGCSQVSVIFITQQSQMMEFPVMSRFNSLILGTMDLALVRNMVDTGGFCGCFLSRAGRPSRQPCFCILSQYRWHHLADLITIQVDPSDCAASCGILWAWWQVFVTVIWHCNLHINQGQMTKVRTQLRTRPYTYDTHCTHTMKKHHIRDPQAKSHKPCVSHYARLIKNLEDKKKMLFWESCNLT